MTESIQGAWLRLSSQLTKQGWPPEILSQFETIFYGGASAAMFLIMRKLDAHSDGRMRPILDEIQGFMDEVKAG